MLIVFGILSAVSFVGTNALKCHDCAHKFDPTNCTRMTNDKTVICDDRVKTCIIGTGVRPEQKENVTKQTAGMTRRCSELHEADHVERWNAANAKGHKMICYMQQVYEFIDRTCICGEDNCNKQIWDEVMVQPVLQVNQSVTGIPVIPTLGENALEKIIAVTYPTNVVLTPSGTSTTLSMTSIGATTANSVFSTVIPKAAESGGLSTGLLAGIAVGGLLLLGLIGFGVYWFMFRKRKERGSADTGASDASADTGASSGEDD